MPMTKLRIRILETGKPAYAIAAHVGIPPSRISEYCLGKRPIPPRHIYKLVDVLGCNVDEIIGYYEDEF